MAGSATQDQWHKKVVEQLCAREGVEHEDLNDGRIALKISYNGASRNVFLAGSSGDFRAQKNQYRQVRKTLTELGIAEGQEFAAAAKRSRRPMTPAMLAARAKQQKEHEAWQEVWRTIRKAEKSLDVEFEIAQMLDYY